MEELPHVKLIASPPARREVSIQPAQVHCRISAALCCSASNTHVFGCVLISCNRSLSKDAESIAAI